MSNVGRLIHRERLSKGLSIRQVATITGRSLGHLKQVEYGYLRGTPETLRCVAAALGISVDTMCEAFMEDAQDTAAQEWNRTLNAQQSVMNKGVEIRSIVT